MKINTDTHYLFRVTNMEDEDKHRYTLLVEDDNKMTLQNMEDEHKHRYTQLQNMEDEHKHRYTRLIQDDKHGR